MATANRIVFPSAGVAALETEELPELGPGQVLMRTTHSLISTGTELALYLDENERQEVPLIDACFMLMRRTAIEEIGPLDERFFMYAEEMDWCRRAHEKGWTIGYDPTGVTVHVKGEITRRHTFRMLYHFHRSMALYYLKHTSRWNPGSVPVLIGIACRYLALTVLNLARRERRISG